MTGGEKNTGPTTLEEAIEISRQHEAAHGVGLATVPNPDLGLVFNLEDRTIAQLAWGEGDNVDEIVRCADTGRVLSRKRVGP